MKISVRPVMVRGTRKWVVSWTPKGEKRKRLYFATKTAADTEAETMRGRQTRCGEVWVAMSASHRDEIVRLMEDAAREGFTIREAMDFYRANRSRVSTVVKIGDAYKTFLAEKEAALISKKSIKALKSNVGRFLKGRELLPLRSITRDDVLGYLRRPEWGPRTFNTYLISIKSFFHWCVKVEYLAKSPAANIDGINERRMPDLDVAPSILAIDQCEAVLRAALQYDSGLVPYIAVGLFAGLRPNREAAKLSRADVFNGAIRVLGLHAKDRQRRDVEIHPTLQAWLDLGGDLPPKNLRRRFERVRAAAGLIRLEKVENKERKKVIPTGWTQDCLRHTFASHYYGIFGAEKTVKQLGHGDYAMLFGHYRALVTQQQADAFWRLTPENVIAKLFSVAA
ncbi:MAG TPA: hypothetical protein VHC44_17160 [Verrucomicrobiae bacterium]|nr:hypothetical protein [Verrucomicrobiae bacterium]